MSGLMTVTVHAPKSDAAKPVNAAGAMACQRMSTRLANWRAEIMVPQTLALLLVPSKVAGGALGKAPNSAGTKMRPPPPTIASTKPANMDASVTNNHSMAPLSHWPWRHSMRGGAFATEQSGCAEKQKAPEGALKGHLLFFVMLNRIFEFSRCLLGPLAEHCLSASSASTIGDCTALVHWDLPQM